MNKRVRRSNSYIQQNNGPLLLGIFIGACLVVVAFAIVISQVMPPYQAAQTGNAALSTPHYAQNTSSRTITFGQTETLDTDADHALVSIIQGSVPSGITQVSVLSDENCTPDAQGISHCLNRLSYGNGEMLVRHMHRMAQVPCLQPGEVLQIVSSANP